MTTGQRYENILDWFSANRPDAASELDFPAAARLRDEMWALQEYLKVWKD